MNRREFVTYSVGACVACATTKISAVLAEDASSAPVAPRIYRCATPPPTPSDQIQANRVRSALRAYRVNFNRTTVIPVHFHVIHEGQRGNLSDARLKSQVKLLNKVYAPALVEFKIGDVTRHEDEHWFRVEPGSPVNAAMKAQLGKDTEHSLNVYTCEPPGLLGYATFPWELAERPDIDGVVLHHASLPGASEPWVEQPWPYDLGMTAAHEIGHWCGLYHTFQGGCVAPGDEIEDTAYEAEAASGCPIDQPSSCPGEQRFNPVENYMDYSFDECMKVFSRQQVGRIKDMVGYYRYQLNPQTARSTRLQQVREAVGI